jgi:glycosyltransferase involved in cell wall biosynthesis
MTLRVALLGPSRNPVVEPFAGGQEAHVATLARALRARGCHVRLYAAPGSDPALADELVTHPTMPDLSASAALDPQLPEPGFLRDQHAFLFVVGDLLARDDVDVVHNSSLHHLPLVAAGALNRPLVTTLHTPPFPWMEVGVALTDPRTRMVAVSADLATRWTTLARPATVIHNGVDVDRFGAGPGGPELVWVGRLVPEKGPELAVLAARRAGLPLRLLGPVPDADWFDRSLRPLLGGDISYEGHLDHDATATVVGKSAALLVTPRWPEPFGLVAVEAALTGTPVVAIGRGGLPEVVDADMGVLVASEEPPSGGTQQRGAAGDEDRIVQGLVDGVAKVRGLDRDRVRRAAREHFGAGLMAQRYEELYREVIAAW